MVIVGFFSLIMSLAIIVGYIWGRRFENPLYGLLIAVFITLSPFFISTGAQLWNPNIIPLLMLVYIWLLFETQNNKSLFWLGLISGVIFEFHTGFGAMLLLATLCLLLTRLVPIKSIKVLFPSLSVCYIYNPAYTF